MGDGECLAELCPAHSVFGLFGHDSVQIEMEASHIVAYQEKSALTECADVDLRRGTLMQPPDVTGRDRRMAFLALQQNRLYAQLQLRRFLALRRLGRTATPATT